MRQLRFNYTFPTGYVQPYPQADQSLLIWPMIYGVDVANALGYANINNMVVSLITTIPPTFMLPSISSQYIHILVPATINTVSSFTVSGSPATFNLMTTTDTDGNVEAYFVIVNGVDYAFNYYVSAITYTGTNVTIGMTPTALPPFIPEPPQVVDLPEA